MLIHLVTLCHIIKGHEHSFAFICYKAIGSQEVQYSLCIFFHQFQDFFFGFSTAACLRIIWIGEGFWVFSYLSCLERVSTLFSNFLSRPKKEVKSCSRCPCFHFTGKFSEWEFSRVRRNILPGNTGSLWTAVKIAKDINTSDLPNSINAKNTNHVKIITLMHNKPFGAV